MTPNNLRQARAKAGLTQAEMACSLGISRRQYGRYENDQALIPRLVDLAVSAITEGAMQGDKSLEIHNQQKEGV